MNRLELEIEFLTPCFISGADQKMVELRAQSLKGVLRWWWRATAGVKFSSISAMKKEEGLLFGSAELKLRSPLLVEARCNVRHVDYGPIPWTYGKKVSSGNYQIDALHYLAYGPMATVSKQERTPNGKALDPKLNDSSGRARKGLVLKRSAIDAGQKFVMSLSWRKGTLSDKQEESILSALSAWLTFGGIGSRSRKGWGSLDLKKVDGQPQDLVSRAKQNISQLSQSFLKDGQEPSGAMPLWANLDYRKILFKSKPSQNWKDALGVAGVQYVAIKSKTPKSHRWIFGSASPRRASSIFVTVKRTPQGLVSFIWAFPCSKEKSMTQEDLTAWKVFGECLLDLWRPKPA